MEPSFAFARDGRIPYQNWVLRDDVAGGVPPYPMMMNAVRVISLRKANRKEHSLYVKAKNHSLQQ